jgi:hypothetical protein
MPPGQRLFLFIIFMLFIVLMIGGTQQSQFAQHNQHNRQTNAEHAAKQNDVIAAEQPEEPIVYYTRWLVIFTAVLALATIVLVVATILLWRTTEGHAEHLEGSADAAKRFADAAATQARAAVGLAIPTVFVSDIKLLGDGDIFFSDRLKPPKIEVTYRNYGQTPAFLAEESVSIVHRKELRNDPIHGTIQQYSPGNVLEATRSVTYVPTGFSSYGWNDDTAKDISANNQYLWIYGYLIFQDFMSNFYEIGFCARFGNYGHPEPQWGFRFGYGPPKYTYSRQRDAPARFNPNLPPFIGATKEA